ncbi:MAG: aquaporin Z [Bdellovibrionota bacterium]
MTLTKRAMAEFFGTFWLVFASCGAAIFAAAFPGLGFGFLGVAFAFGLSLLTIAYAIGPISGCHINPAVSVGLAVGGRFPAKELPAYIIAQVLGAIVAAAVLYAFASTNAGFDVSTGFAANGYGEHSPGGFPFAVGFFAEIILTFFFVFIIQAVTEKSAPVGFAPIAIGLALTVVHLIDIPLTNASVNPARSTGQAIFAGGWALAQLWMFWVAPMIGGILAGVAYPALARARVAREPGLSAELPRRRAG